MQLFLRGMARTYTLDGIEPNATIGSLFLVVQDRCGVPSHLQSLRWKKCFFAQSSESIELRLSDIGIQAGDTINISMRMHSNPLADAVQPGMQVSKAHVSGTHVSDHIGRTPSSFTSPKFVEDAIRNNWRSLEQASPELRADKEFLLSIARSIYAKAILSDLPNFLIYADPSLRDDYNFVEELMCVQLSCYKSATHRVRQNLFKHACALLMRRTSTTGATVPSLFTSIKEIEGLLSPIQVRQSQHSGSSSSSVYLSTKVVSEYDKFYNLGNNMEGSCMIPLTGTNWKSNVLQMFNAVSDDFLKDESCLISLIEPAKESASASGFWWSLVPVETW